MLAENIILGAVTSQRGIQKHSRVICIHLYVSWKAYFTEEIRVFSYKVVNNIDYNLVGSF